MAVSRLTTALTEGFLDLPAGKVTIMRPAADYDVSALDRDEILISNGYYPDFSAWSDAGYAATAQAEKSEVAIVVVPKSKALARAMIAQAARWAKLVVVDGQKDNGIDSHYKACRKALGELPTVTKAHGRIFWFNGADQFADWKVGPPDVGTHGFATTAGVFSENAVDKGSILLAEALPEKLPAKLADLGAGWGYLSAKALEKSGVQSVGLIEAEALSLDCARLNVTDPRATFHWADATRFEPKVKYDGVIMNPPFHSGHASEPRLGQAFIAQAARILAPHGKLWMVANRHLPYETCLREHFRNVDEIAGNGAFKVFHATRPTRKKG